MLGLSLLRVRRQLLATLLVVAVVASSSLAFILIPSLSTNLSAGLTGYSNGAATYIVVQNNPLYSAGGVGCEAGTSTCSVLPPSLVSGISSLPGVEKSYATVDYMVYNHYVFSKPMNETGSCGNCPPGVTPPPMTGVEAGLLSGVIGNGSYPRSLVQLSSGRLPQVGAAEFVLPSWIASAGGIFFNYTLGNTYTFHLNGRNRMFNCTFVGIEAQNPLLSGIYTGTQILFDEAFMRNLLGPSLYGQTYGGSAANQVVIKAGSLGDVQPTVNSLNSLLANYSDFKITYDQAAVNNLQAYDSQTAPLYLFLSVVAMVSGAAATLFVFYMGVGRREWEAGLLVSQGWSWRDLTKYFSYYYLPITLSGWAAATILSYIIGPQVAFGFAVYGTSLVMSAYPVLTFVLLGFAVMLALAFASSWLAVHRLEKKGLDEILREM